MNIKELLNHIIKSAASDLHVVVNQYPTLRVDGVLYPLTVFPVVSAKDASELFIPILTTDQQSTLSTNRELDMGYEYEGHRFRVNLYFARNNLSASFRLIPAKIRTIEELALPPSISKIVGLNSGLVLVTGPTGEGKSTTIASLINQINLQYARHILTVEDPIEFTYEQGKSIVSQRELHQDTHSWNNSLRAALREDPDVVFVGEIRDYESAAHVLTLAETGHLVFSTLHTISSVDTINRLVDIFPSHQQNQIRAQLASVLRTVISQRLLPRLDQKGRVVGVEILHNNSAVANIIREGKTHLLENVLQTTEAEGFIYFEKYLMNLYVTGKISEETARTYAIRPKAILKFMER